MEAPEQHPDMYNGELLPELSSSAKKMNMGKLLSAPLPTPSGPTPGSPFWTRLAFWMCRRVARVQFRTTSTSTVESLDQPHGAMCCGWHTNGLMDPLGVFLGHPKHFVVGARHDLVTRPLLGWWTRRLAVQPVVRKAELLRGGCSEEEASYINGRSLLALSSGIAHGFGCVLFPEGTSHDKSHMIRFKTGPIRTILAAAALAKASDLPLPALIPVGLHFRRKEYFRTDQYVEFGQSIRIEPNDLPNDMVEAVKQGGWVEPPAELVHSIRDRLQAVLPAQTANLSTWEEHRAVHLLAHIKARHAGQSLNNWQEEVHAARIIRDQWSDHETTFPPTPLVGERIELAKEASAIMDAKNLDGRDLDTTGTRLRRANPLKLPGALVRLAFFLLMLPLAITSLGLQVTLGRLLGDSTDEGLDARTSYQFLAAFFGSMLIWPFIALAWTAAAWFGHDTLTGLIGQDWRYMLGQESAWLMCMTFFVGLFPLFWLSGRSFALAWDVVVDTKKSISRRRLPNGQRERLNKALERLLELERNTS
ncbi:MAG: 1-acyl-sn-glycerol-3-phosphate acyltransferase [Candidatus Poseidonia sp.]|nr:1-acyl-sn-glycerol-3-phosphate acyltransferase [Poseidonia sp.]